MKEYIAKEYLQDFANEHGFIVEWQVVETVTKADICREFFEELRTRMYQGRDTSYQGMCDKGYELLAEMEVKMVRYQAKEELEKLLDTIDKEDEENEDLVDALKFAIADMDTLQGIFVVLAGVCEE